MALDMPPSMHLQFGPWLMTQISSGKYLGLEWVDGENRTMFKIPWTKVNYPMWEEHHKIFQAWAIHRGKNVSPSGKMEQSYSQIKSNFRTILRKCVEIEEVEGSHQLGLQMGNYKVYRILTPEESMSKRKTLHELKKQSVKAQMARYRGTFNGEATSHGRGRPAKIRKRDNSTKSTVVTPVMPKFENGSMRTISTQTVVEDYHEVPDVQFFLEPAAFEEAKDTEDVNLMVKGQGACIDIIVNEDKPHNAAIATQTEIKEDPPSIDSEPPAPNNLHGFQMLLDAAQLAEDPLQCEISDSDTCVEVAAPAKKKIPPSVVDVLMELKIPPDELFTYVMHVRYEARKVLENVELNDMSYGYRIHYGNHTVQKNFIERFQPRKELIEDFARTPVTLPESKVPPGNALYTVLKNIDAGLIVKSDNQYMLRAKRLCMSRVYAFTAYGEVDADTEPLLMLRNHETVLFSYKSFLRDWHRFLIDGSPRPNHEINLAFGKKIKHRHNRVFVAITLIPKAAETMLQRISENMDDAMLDNVLRLFNPESL